MLRRRAEALRRRAPTCLCVQIWIVRMDSAHAHCLVLMQPVTWWARTDIEERFNPFRRQVEEKERAAHHATRIKTVHSRAIVKAQESRQQFVEKEKVREQRLHDKHRQEQMLVQLQGLQRSWLKHLVLFHSAHLLLHAATVHTHLNAINKAPGMAYLHTHRSTPLVTRAAATTRQRMALRQKQEAQRTNTLVPCLFHTISLCSCLYECVSVLRLVVERES